MAGRRPGDVRTGIVVPLLRSFGLVAIMTLIAVGIAALSGAIIAFYVVMFGGSLAMWLLDAHIRPNRAMEDAARRRVFGIDN